VRAGFDPKTIWVHSFRKAFRKIVRQADIDDTKEQLMGHTLKGAREAYFDRHDVELIKAAYEKCNFARSAKKRSQQTAPAVGGFRG
jgi:integrase